jgi:hypothetical protein
MHALGPFDPERLFLAENLGPCHATVLVEKVRWRSGAIKFSLTETFQPKDAPGVGTISVTDVYENGEAAVMMGRRRAAQWQASSDRAHELAPGGRLRELRRAS